jgi:hypothetical protein
MSMTARHENRKFRQMCQQCQDRKARFEYRGEVRADRDHTLCFECYRSERERQRARTVAWVQSPMLRPLSGAGPTLSERQIAHRRQMVAHLGGCKT